MCKTCLNILSEIDFFVKLEKEDRWVFAINVDDSKHRKYSIIVHKSSINNDYCDTFIIKRVIEDIDSYNHLNKFKIFKGEELINNIIEYLKENEPSIKRYFQYLK